MILDSTTKSLQVVLNATPATTQASIVASWADLTATTFIGGNTDLTSNGTTAVTAVAAPAASTQRQLKNLNIYNADSAYITVTVQLLDGATVRVLYKATLAPGQTLVWTAEQGWVTASLQAASTPDFISGLKMSWVSGSSLTISGGEAWVPGANQLAVVNTPVTLTGIALGNSVFGHVYVNAAGSFQCVTTAPAAPYAGTARTKTGDSTWRYVGSVLTDATGNIFNFQHLVFGQMLYQTSTDGAQFKVLIGNATTATSVSCSSCVPITGNRASANIINNDTTHVAYLGNSSIVPSTTNYLEQIGTGTSGTTLSTEILLDTSQAFQYIYTAGATANLVVRIKGYTFER